jgi:uncharacterized protein (TIGR02246 family)
MTDDQAIRALVAEWQRATADGDVDRVLALMAEDVVFLTAGRPPLRGRDELAALQRAAGGQYRFDPLQSSIDIKELNVHGEWAHGWSHLTVTMVPLAAGHDPIRRSGHTLTIFHKRADGTWELARDANLLTVDK